MLINNEYPLITWLIRFSLAIGDAISTCSVYVLRPLACAEDKMDYQVVLIVIEYVELHCT